MARDWSAIQHFQREEWVMDPDRVLWDVVVLTDEMREATGGPIKIHVAWDSAGHVQDSSHYTRGTEYASGVDLDFQGWPLVDQWLFAERFPWVGIGLYPFWKTPGLHLDLRKLGQDHPHLGKRWWRDAAGEYRALDKAFLKSLIEEDS